MDGFGDRLFTTFLAENPLIDPLVSLVFEVSFGNMETVLRNVIQGTGKPKASVSALLEDSGPFTGFKGDPVRACESCRYKSDIFMHSNRTRAAMFQKGSRNYFMINRKSAAGYPADR